LNRRPLELLLLPHTQKIGVRFSFANVVTATPSILVADDNPDDVFLLRQAFKKAGIMKPFTVVKDGIETVAYLGGEGVYHDRATYPLPELLLLDLNMPRQNGFEVLEWIRNNPRWKRLIVHVVTASARVADVKRAYDLHANSYVVKPTRMDHLVDFVVALHSWHPFVALASAPDPSL
jgi:CheY-like chemotaxis protein